MSSNQQLPSPKSWQMIPSMEHSIMENLMNTQSVVALANVPARSLLGWMLVTLFSSWTGLLVLLSAAAIFCGACYLVFTRRPAAALAAYLVFLPLPLMIAVCRLLKGMISSFSVLSLTDQSVSASEWFGAWAATCLDLQFAVLATAPSYFVLAFGLLARALKMPPDAAQPVPVRSGNPLPLPALGKGIPSVT